MHYWGAFKAVPQWTIALIALVIVLTVNMISVKLFGEIQFWAALIKVVALVTFLVVGIVFLAGRFTIKGQSTGFSRHRRQRGHPADRCAAAGDHHLERDFRLRRSGIGGRRGR
jgi:L-asparagine transporter-like permease